MPPPFIAPNSAKNRTQREYPFRGKPGRGVGPADVVRNRHAPGRLFTPNALAALAFEKMNYGRAVDFNDRFYEGKLLRADSAHFVRLVIKRGNFFSLE